MKTHLFTLSLLKIAYTFSLTILPMITYAQGLTGNWQGQMSGQGGTLPSTLTLKASGNTLSGTMVFTQNGAVETYQLTGQTDGTVGAGSVLFNGQQAFAFEMQLTNGKLAVVLGNNGQALLQGQYARGSGNSTQSARAPAVAKPPTSGLAGQWDQLIRGRRLLYLKTGNGLAQKWFYDLCSNGTYVYSNDTGYMSGDFTAALANGGSGTWRVAVENNAAYLVFSPRDDSPFTKLMVPRAQGEINLNGQRYFLTRNESCQ